MQDLTPLLGLSLVPARGHVVDGSRVENAKRTRHAHDASREPVTRLPRLCNESERGSGLAFTQHQAAAPARLRDGVVMQDLTPGLRWMRRRP